MHQLQITDASWVIQACAECFPGPWPLQMPVFMYSPLSPPLQSSHSSCRCHPAGRMNHPSPAAVCIWSPVSWLLPIAGPYKSLPVVRPWKPYMALAIREHVKSQSVKCNLQSSQGCEVYTRQKGIDELPLLLWFSALLALMVREEDKEQVQTSR